MASYIDIAKSALQSAQITPDQRQRMITSRRGQLAAELQSATGNIDPYSGVQRGGVSRTAQGYGVASANLPINLDMELTELNRLLAGTASGIDTQQRSSDLAEKQYGLQEKQFKLQQREYDDKIKMLNAELKAAAEQATQARHDAFWDEEQRKKEEQKAKNIAYKNALNEWEKTVPDKYLRRSPYLIPQRYLKTKPTAYNY